MAREISRTHVRQVVRRGLEDARGNYKMVAGLFNLEPRDYKRFLNFLAETRLPAAIHGIPQLRSRKLAKLRLRLASMEERLRFADME